MKDKTNMKIKTMNALKFSSPFKNAFCRSSRGNEAHFFQDISNDSRASLRRLLLFFQQPVSAVLALFIFAEIGRTDPLDTWTWRQSGTQSELTDIAYGNSKFVAVGTATQYGDGSSTTVTSADGVNWTERQLGSG